MASICNDERARFGVMSGHGRNTHSLSVHADAASLPAELRIMLAAEPQRREAAGSEGRHYHVRALQRPGGPPWLVADVSQQLIVRPMRQELLGWLLGWGLLVAALSLALARALARRISAPLERLAAQVTQGAPEQLPQRLAQGTGDDEVGALARAFDALLDRTRAFISREQLFTRDASHELRTPLTVLRMAIERLQGQAELPTTVLQHCARPPKRPPLPPLRWLTRCGCSGTGCAIHWALCRDSADTDSRSVDDLSAEVRPLTWP